MIFGKLAGGFFGFLFGLPFGVSLFGMLFGIWYGHRLDVAVEKLGWAKMGFQFHSQTLLKDRFHKCLFSIMGFIAKSDGQVDQDEIRMASIFMQRLGLKSHAEKTMVIDAFNYGKSLSFNLDQQINIIRTLGFGNPKLLNQFCMLQKEAATLNGQIHPQKQKILNYLFQKLLHQHQPFSFVPNTQSLSADYKALGIERGAKPEAIKKAYKRMMGKYHPDRLEASGVGEQRLKEATAKAQSIKAAYERICEVEGI